MKVAIIGDRGIPARYSGFSTLVEELSVRLVERHGMDVTVYGRTQYFEAHPASYRGVKLVWLRAPGGKHFESILHTNRAVMHAALRRRFDVIFLVDPGNGPFCLPLKFRRVPVIIHTDGLGWKRSKWSRTQRRYYKWSEWCSAKLADWLVTDSHAMVDYYHCEYRTDCSFIPYGSVVGERPTSDAPARHGLTPGGYYLLVARIEPDNNPLLLIREFQQSRTERPLVVVGGVPYASPYWDEVRAQAGPRIKILGSIFDSGELNGLWRNCYAYLHGHEVGGTNPSLLRAMAAGAAPLVLGVDFNREVVGRDAPYFTREPGSLAALLDRLDVDPAAVETLRQQSLARSRREYRWDAVADGYARMFEAVRERKRGRRGRSDLARATFYRPEAFSGHEDWSSS